MLSSNISAFLKLLAASGELAVNLDDEIIRETLVTHEGKVVHARLAELISASQGAERPVTA
jgi:NAD(P) transhydrogenase subunit alpha